MELNSGHTAEGVVLPKAETQLAAAELAIAITSQWGLAFAEQLACEVIKLVIPEAGK